MEMLPFFDSKSVPDSEVITVWRLQGDPNTGLVCQIELEKYWAGTFADLFFFFFFYTLHLGDLTSLSHSYVSKSHCACQNHIAFGNNTLRVEITLCV
jgi:hypothetical protein